MTPWEGIRMFTLYPYNQWNFFYTITLVWYVMCRSQSRGGMGMGMLTLFWYAICSTQTKGTLLILEACLLVKPLY